jgi:hydroxyethylthiazole kinase-like uncharacterized protein yjeF
MGNADTVIKPLDIDDDKARVLLRDRPWNAHKGTMGHAALFAGSYGMAGAAILAGRACLRAGVGKLTLFTDERCYPILQSSVPEAVFRFLEPSHPVDVDGLRRYDAIGAGPGWGMHSENAPLLEGILKSGCPTVLDADALNLMAVQRHLLDLLPKHAILTPHGAEYARLFGKDAVPDEVSRRHGCILVMKGPDTLVYTPEGAVYRNTTGNPGMATAGSGDVLTGIVLGLLSRGYAAPEAARLAVFLHGRSGDLASRSVGMESLIASDLIEYLGPAFLSVEPSLF